MFVGVGASRVRDLFEQGKKNAPCIIFIDEIDAVGRHRGAGLGGGHDEREQTLNALLVEMDGFESNEGVILIAATNRPDVLDPALLRPGRFDRRVVVARPDVKGREEILRVHTRKVPIADDVDLSIIARGTPDFLRGPGEPGERGGAVGGAAKPQVCDDVGLRDVQGQSPDGRRTQVDDFVRRREEEHGVSRGWTRAGGGHGLPAPTRCTRSRLFRAALALGLTMQLPEDDKHTYTREYLETMLAVLMGGRSAEEIFLGHITTGAGNDIERATDIARNMVCEWA